MRSQCPVKDWYAQGVHEISLQQACVAGPEMRQVGGPASPGQQRNMRLCSQLQEAHRSLLTLLPRMQPPALM